MNQEVSISEAKFLQVADNIQEGVIILDADKKVEYISPACLRLFGYSQTDDLTKLEHSIFSCMQPEDRFLFFTDLNVMIGKGKSSFAFIANLLRPAGKSVLVELSSCVYYNAGGNYSFTAIICHDLAASFHHEQIRLDAMDQLQEIASKAPGVIYQLRLRPDGSSSMPYASPALQDVTGASPAEVKDDAGKFYASIHTDDIDNFIAAMEHSAANLSPWQHAYRRLMPDGQIRFYYCNALPQQEADGSTLWNGFITDITTERLAAPAHDINRTGFREIFNNHSAIMLLVHPSTGRIIDLNQAAVTYYGYAGDLLGELNIADINQLHKTALEEMLVNAITGVIKKFIVPQLLADGTRRTVQILTSPWQHESEQVVFAIVDDVTDIEDEIIALKKEYAALQVSNRHLESFAYIAGHELQEPLRMVSGFTIALENRLKEQLDERSLMYLHYATDGAQRMQLLISDLLLYSKLSNSTEKFTVVNMNAVMDYIMLVMANNLEEVPFIKVHGLLPDIRCSKTLITQLFMNLVKNAIKYNNKKIVNISIGCEQEDNNYVFYVKDNGIGIDEENYEQIFDLFKRLHTKEDYAGTGIGLALCKRITEIHNGNIWVESKKDEGSTFYVSIPRHSS